MNGKESGDNMPDKLLIDIDYLKEYFFVEILAKVMGLVLLMP